MTFTVCSHNIEQSLTLLTAAFTVYDVLVLTDVCLHLSRPALTDSDPEAKYVV